MNITDTQKYLVSGKLKPELKEKLIAETKHAMQKTAKEVQKEAQRKDDEKPITPLAVEKTIPAPDVQFTDTARLKVALDIEINLVEIGRASCRERV